MVSTAIQDTTFQSMPQFPGRLASLIDQLSQTQIQSPQIVKKLVEDAQITQDDLMAWADFEHPVWDCYGRKMVFDGGHFEVMVMSWVPGDFSAIHDHGGTQWGAVQCFGSAEHYMYHFDGKTLTHHDAAHYTPGMVRGVSHDLIHQMGNSSDEAFLSLHVYGNEAVTGNITGNARIFDLCEENIQYTDGGVFFCLPEADINHRDTPIKGDRISTRRHHMQMRDRLYRILSQSDSQELRNKLCEIEVRI